MDLEEVGRRAIPMLVRANVRNAMKTIMFMKKLDIRKTSGSPVMDYYPRYHKGSMFDGRVHHYYSREQYPDFPITVQPTYRRKHSHAPYRYAASTSHPVYHSVPRHHPMSHHHSKWVLRVPPNEQQIMQRDVMDFTEKILDSFPNPIEDFIFRL